MTRLYVGNVSTKAESNELRDLFSECGKLKYVDIKDGSGYMVKDLNNL
jgi:RNA recognition motif-containing protein